MLLPLVGNKNNKTYTLSLSVISSKGLGERVSMCLSVFSVLLILLPLPANAHAFGQRYDLPLPLEVFIWGGAVAVLISFGIIALFTHHTPIPNAYPRLNLINNPIGKVLTHPITTGLIRALFTTFFILIIAAGFLGHQSPLRNISIVMVWVVAWVGLAFICALFGNFWALINPWNSLFRYAENIRKKLDGGELSLNKPYPIPLGYWPAFIFFFSFAWLEINWSEASVPSSVAAALSIYTALNFLGMFVYGRDVWLKHGECFTVVYTLFAKFSITEGKMTDETTEWFLRPPGVGLRNHGAPTNIPSLSLMLFILLLLSTVTYDGFTETNTFKDATLTYYYFFQDITGKGFAETALSLADTIGLLVFPILFVAVYLFFISMIAFMDGETSDILKLARIFVFSIIPISISYHLSHYISLLAIEGQLALRLASDPFGFGWDLFGTAADKANIAIINAKFVWYFSVILIVLGHIVAVYIAHAEAIRFYEHRYRALVSQIPMLVLMVGYTMLSLWIIAQPIVG